VILRSAGWDMRPQEATCGHSSREFPAGRLSRLPVRHTLMIPALSFPSTETPPDRLSRYWCRPRGTVLPHRLSAER